jgi:hypothetical protein
MVEVGIASPSFALAARRDFSGAQAALLISQD